MFGVFEVQYFGVRSKTTCNLVNQHLLLILLDTYLTLSHYYKIHKKCHFVMVAELFALVMGRAWNFRASGGLGLLCIGPRAGRAFLYRASGFIRAFLKYEIYLNYRKKRPNIFFKIFFSLFCPMFGWNFGQNSGQNSAAF